MTHRERLEVAGFGLIMIVALPALMLAAQLAA
jgi:hypothetical protein